MWQTIVCLVFAIYTFIQTPSTEVSAVVQKLLTQMWLLGAIICSLRRR